MRIGIVNWQLHDGIAQAISTSAEALGCETISFLHDADLPAHLDVVLTYGPLGSLVPLARHLTTLPPAKRPPLALWLTEQLPNPAIPEWIRYLVGRLRSTTERIYYDRATEAGGPARYLTWLTKGGRRFRYYGDLYWLRQERLLSVLATTSRWTANFLKDRGFDPIVAYVGAPPDWGASLGLDRDIPVLWLGKAGTRRRQRLLRRIRAELGLRGIEILVVDGIENPYIFGEQRTILLNRTKIVLNLLRAKWDDNSMRYFLAAPNRAMILTEPTLPHTPFVAGVHLIEAPVDQMAETICYYLAHEDERERVAEEAYRLVANDLTMEKAVSQILHQAIIA